MFIYIFTAAISSWIIWFEEKISNKDNRFKKILLLIAILIPAIVAGMRADTIGTDVRTYIGPLQYFAASSNNFAEYINYNGLLFNGEYLLRFEKGYLSLIYLCSRIDKSLFLTFFVSELIILSTLIIGLYEFNKKYPLSIGLGFFIFLTFFYNLSFNLSRQCIAIFILFLGFNFLIRKEWIKYIITIFIAVLFHNSAVIGVFFLFIYYFLDDKAKDNNNLFTSSELKVLMITIIGLVILFMPSLIKHIFSSTLLNTYLNYIPDSIHLSVRQLIIKLPFLIIILIEWENMKKNRLRYFYLAIALMDILLSQFSGQSSSATVSEYGARISWYTSAFYIYSIPNALKTDLNKNRKIILTIGLVVFLSIYWYYFTVVLNYNDTFPYVFSNIFK